MTNYTANNRHYSARPLMGQQSSLDFKSSTLVYTLANTLSAFLSLTIVLLALISNPTAAETVSPVDSIRSMLSQLSNTQRAAIAEQCSSFENDSTNIAYRQCIQKTINPISSNDMAAFDALTFDDKYAVQQACAVDRRHAELTYQDCLLLEVAELSLIPEPVLANLPENEQYVLRQSCFSTQTESGGAAYRLCMNNEISLLSQVESVDLSFLSTLDRNAIQLACSPSTATLSVSAYRQCLSREIAESGLARQRTQLTSSRPERSNTVKVSTNPVEAVIRSVPAETISPESNVALITKEVDSDSNSVVSTPAVSPEANSTQYSSTTTTTVNTAITATPGTPATSAENTSIRSLMTALLDSSNRPAWLLYVVPLLLILVFIQLLRVLLRRRDAAERRQWQNTPSKIDFDSESPFGEWDLPEHPSSKRVSPNLKERWLTDNEHPDDFLQDLEADNKALKKRVRSPVRATNPNLNVDTDLNHDFDETILVSSDQDATIAMAEFERLAQQRISQPIDKNEKTTTTGDDVTHAAPPDLHPISDFGRQLAMLNEEDRKRQTTEFLLYWISYADENYDPDQAAQILQNDSQDEHDLIKKWVLQKDAKALKDALHYLTVGFSEQEVRQTINLLLAVLVQNVPTPVQNTLFHFIADFVGIGAVGLNRQYKYLFARDFPSLSRPDLISWWEQQPKQAPAQDEHLRLLGLNDNATRHDVIQAQTRIEQRFDPALFHRLGKKQQALAERYAERYRTACAELLQETTT